MHASQNMFQNQISQHTSSQRHHSKTLHKIFSKIECNPIKMSIIFIISLHTSVFYWRASFFQVQWRWNSSLLLTFMFSESFFLRKVFKINVSKFFIKILQSSSERITDANNNNSFMWFFPSRIINKFHLRLICKQRSKFKLAEMLSSLYSFARFNMIYVERKSGRTAWEIWK